MSNLVMTGISRQMRIVSALTIREVRLRNSKHAFKQLFDLGEMLFAIVIHWGIFEFTHHKLLIGDSLLLFIMTGLFPVLYFRIISMRAATAIDASRAVTIIPYIEAIDYAIARCFVEFLAFTMIFIMMLAMIGLFGTSRFIFPYRPFAFIEFLILISLFAFGIGLINAFLIYLVPIWRIAWSLIARVQIFFAAVFYIPEYMNEHMRYYLSFSPIMHFVALCRSAFYPTYPMHLLSVNYILGWTAAVMMLGLAIERALRNYRAAN
ncbi:ABC transporter permease [Rhizobium sp. YIM 134829]|uniref:ABC transporter permease n=1 Tax=Rhizobium sp. YIM 134829 TaxID=3390453 RepID=UPI00397AC378